MQIPRFHLPVLALVLTTGLGLAPSHALFGQGSASGQDSASGQGSAQEQGKTEPQKDLLLRVGRLHVGNGQVLSKVRVLIQNGKIAKIGKDEGPLPEDTEVLDLSRKTLIPGLVSAYSELSARDVSYNVAPDEMAIDNFDWFRKHPTLLRSGLTTIYLAPGKARLVSGQGSVVKLFGKDPSTRKLANSACLQVNLTDAARRSVPAIFEPVPTPNNESPLLPSRRQRGSSRASQLEVLRKAFLEAKEGPAGGIGGDGPSEARYYLTSLQEALEGKLPIRLATSKADDILHGMELFADLGASLYLDRPTQAPLLAKELAEKQIPVVLSVPMRPSVPAAGDYDKLAQENLQLGPDHAGTLALAGVKVVLVPQNDADLDKLRLVAGIAARYGLDRQKALSAITLEAARVLGVADRVGSIEVGKDADLVVLTGEPFDARSRVERVLVDGALAWKSKTTQSPFAIRAGRVLLGNGEEMRNAIVVVQNGRITDVGPYAELPPGTELREFPDGVLVPGFIAPATLLGLHSDSGGTVSANTTIDVASHLTAKDPAFRTALENGITSLFVTPASNSTVGARIAAVKTDCSGKAFVTQPVAGLRMSLAGGGSKGIAQIQAILKKARAYVNPPKPKAAKKPEPKKPTPKKPTTTKSDAPTVDISGKWTAAATMAGPGGGRKIQIPFEMGQKGKEITLDLRLPGFPVPLKGKGTFEKNKLKVALVAKMGSREMKASVEADYADDKLTGKLTLNFGRRPQVIAFVASRGSGVKPVAKEKKKVKKVKKDEKLEPFRAVFNQGAPLVVNCRNRDAVLAAVEAVVTKEKLRLVVQGAARELVKKPVTLPAGAKIGYLLRVTETSYTEKGKVMDVASALAHQGFEVILYAGVQKGTAHLPLHVAWSVAQGFDARRALASLTSAAAASFGLQKRIGSIAKGCDADLVLLSGDPFDLTSQV